MANNYELSIDKSAIASGENMEMLKESAKELFSANEADFEQIKASTWYKRLWKMVTFSKDNEKMMANNITSLAKAQDIVLKLLLSLSDNNLECSQLVTELTQRVDMLKNVTLNIAQKVVEINSFNRYGYKKSESIDSFSDAQKSVFLSALNFVVDAHSYDNALNYLAAIGKMARFKEIGAGFAPQTFNFESKESKAIYPILLELNYACTGDSELCNEISDIVDCLSISNADMKKVREQVQQNIQRLGIAGVTQLYSAIAPDYAVDDTDIELLAMPEQATANEAETAIEEEVVVWEDITLKGAIPISKDETKIFKNKSIHVNAFVQCYGKLIFENCEIFYNEKLGDPCKITLDEGACLEIKRCTIICKNTADKAFVYVQSASDIVINDSLFEDCSQFISGDFDKNGKFILTRCRITNPHLGFFSLCGGDIKISRSVISFNKAMPPKDGPLSYIFNGSCGEDEFFSIATVLVEGFKGLNKKDEHFNCTNFDYVFSVGEAYFYRCTFKNIIGCISSADTVSHCRFEDCDEVVSFGQWNPNSDERKLEQCIFERCENIVGTRTITDISFCQFISCRNSLVYSDSLGSSSIQYCEFYNTRFENPCSYATSCLSFHRMKFTKNSYSSIKNCVFDGADLIYTEEDDGFLIEGKLYDKMDSPALWIENCSFHNCKTNREDEEIIKTEGVYAKLFSKKLSNIKTVSISNSSGLDNVNQENSVAEDISIRTTGEKDRVIGVVYEPNAVGAVGKPE